MISYELAKKLKDAGFPKETIEYKICKECGRAVPPVDGYPTLEELIEACEDKGTFALIKIFKDTVIGWQWEASCPHLTRREIVKAVGSTSKEAVANLYLELNKK